MAKATWRKALLAESENYIALEGNIYFPPDSVKWEFLSDGDRQYTCPWKGKAKYYHITVDGEVKKNAAWNYPEPKEASPNDQGLCRL
jgi:uncharacterized protein (DUF427 family)